MITLSEHARWPLDVPIADLAAAGLPVASLVRFELFPLDHRLVRDVWAALSSKDADRVATRVQTLFI